MANLRSIGQAMFIYVNDNKGVLPYGFVVGPPSPTTIKVNGVTMAYTGDTADWTTLLLSVMMKKDPGYNTGSQFVTTGNMGLRATFMCPTVAVEPQSAQIITHYSAHPRILPDLGTIDWLSPPMTQSTITAYRLARIKRGAEMIAIFDATINNPSGGNGQYVAFADAFALNKKGVTSTPYLTDQYPAGKTPATPLDLTPFSTSGISTPVANYINTDSDKNLGNIRFRHNGNTQANCLMLDGHVQAFNYNKSTQTTDVVLNNVCVNYP
jgi:prepilin-type processing-associated H-X9-DG protein